jgi:hypothetical protein
MQLHYEKFFRDPGSTKKMNCRVCGAVCGVEKDVYGPVNFAMAMAKVNDLYDVFTCPHGGKDWHEKALALVVEIERTPSKRIADLMKLDLEDMLKENGIIV